MRVYYLHYQDTMQSSCLRLMAKKMLVSLAMEGKFSSQGLNALEEDDNVLTAMARELVTQQRIGELAEPIWRELQAQQRSLAAADLAPPTESGTDAGAHATARNRRRSCPTLAQAEHRLASIAASPKGYLHLPVLERRAVDDNGAQAQFAQRTLHQRFTFSRLASMKFSLTAAFSMP